MAGCFFNISDRLLYKRWYVSGTCFAVFVSADGWVVQAVDRALLVDTLPSSSQPAGNAWAARMLGAGSVVGFYV